MPLRRVKPGMAAVRIAGVSRRAGVTGGAGGWRPMPGGAGPPAIAAVTDAAGRVESTNRPWPIDLREERAALARKQKGPRATALRPLGHAHPAGRDEEIARLLAELVAARARLGQIERDGIDAFTRKRLAELEEARQVARGQALEAAVARSKAEAALKALEDAILRAPGMRGRLLRWAAGRAIRG
jgi:hypothetical protein